MNKILQVKKTVIPNQHHPLKIELSPCQPAWRSPKAGPGPGCWSQVSCNQCTGTLSWSWNLTPVCGRLQKTVVKKNIHIKSWFPKNTPLKCSGKRKILNFGSCWFPLVSEFGSNSGSGSAIHLRLWHKFKNICSINLAIQKTWLSKTFKLASLKLFYKVIAYCIEIILYGSRKN